MLHRPKVVDRNPKAADHMAHTQSRAQEAQQLQRHTLAAELKVDIVPVRGRSVGLSLRVAKIQLRLQGRFVQVLGQRPGQASRDRALQKLADGAVRQAQAPGHLPDAQAAGITKSQGLFDPAH
ncbi:MAG: hypothetical protein Q8P50_11335 [Bacillota bacterium]|nr:hypothetical protein [Bacillota bacterium]